MKKYDESEYAKNIAKIIGTEYNEHTNEKDALNIILRSKVYDEPLRLSQIPILLSKFAKQQLLLLMVMEEMNYLVVTICMFKKILEKNFNFTLSPKKNFCSNY